MLDELTNIVRFIASHPLTQDQKLSAFARFVRWQINCRLQAEPIVPWVAGTKLAIRRGMKGATGNIYTGLHEFKDMAFTLHFLRPGDLFADVGANVGTYTVLASGVCRARTLAFEPDPFTVSALINNVALNELQDLVTIRTEALGAEASEGYFTIGLDTTNRVVPQATDSTRMVLIETCDRVVGDDVPIFIKLDAEGYELQILRGATKTLSAPTVKALLTEDRSDSVVELLNAADFVEHSYDPFTRRLTVSGNASVGNALFIRDSAFVQRRLLEAASIDVLGRTL